MIIIDKCTGSRVKENQNTLAADVVLLTLHQQHYTEVAVRRMEMVHLCISNEEKEC